MIEILIGGDICPINRNLPLFQAGDASGIFHDLLEYFQRADISLVNLECPLIKVESPIEKCGPVLGVSSDCVKGIKAAGIDIVNLANNHILDHSAQGLGNTMRVCEASGIRTFGAGRNIKAAREIVVVEAKGKRIGFLGMAEHEFSISPIGSWGANPLDLIDYVRNLRDRKNDYDYLIVLLHGGKEYYPYPTPRLMETCRFLVEMGADAVICQHSHCPVCFETYKGSHIVYGQGNLIFDRYPVPTDSWCKGFLVKLTISGEKDSTLAVIPYIQSDSQTGARRMNSEEEMEFLKAIDKRSIEILVKDFVQERWLEYCRLERNNYLSAVLMPNRVLSRLNRKGSIIKCFYGRKFFFRMRAFIECETHREVISTVLNDELNLTP